MTSPYTRAYEAGVKLAHSEMEKKALLTRILKPISSGYTGKALASRIAPLGGRRILSEIGHGLGDLTVGAGLGHLAGLPLEAAAGVGAITAGLGAEFGNAMRANKYLEKALGAGPNKLGLDDLKYLHGEMDDLSNYVGASSLYESMAGQTARNRVEKAIEQLERTAK